MRGPPDVITRNVVEAVDSLFNKWYPHLLPLWATLKLEKIFGSTRKVILDEWEALIDLLAFACKGKRSTKEATNFTLARFQRWEGTLRGWINSDDIQRVLHEKTPSVERGKHELCGILGQIDEVCILPS